MRMECMGMRDGAWKLIASPKSAKKKFVGIYDLSTDIGEKTNLIDNHPERVAMMMASLEAWLVEVTENSTPQRNDAAP